VEDTLLHLHLLFKVPKLSKLFFHPKYPYNNNPSSKYPIDDETMGKLIHTKQNDIKPNPPARSSSSFGKSFNLLL
jgi:hypothetical protein